MVGRLLWAVIAVNAVALAGVTASQYRAYRHWLVGQTEGWTRIDDIEARYAYERWLLDEYRRQFEEE